MGKRYGKPYDPALRKTEHGALLYQIWKRVTKCDHIKDWGYFPTFYEWAMSDGYDAGEWLRRFDKNEPFSPDNCFWYSVKEEKDHIPPELGAKWNKTVNRIRKYYGMPPLEGTDYGDL